jgi:uncharacterized phage protein (TIGR01671 family)
MNREIKFRVWDKSLKTMIYFPNHYYEAIYFDGKPWNDENQTPLQYTGLKDQNGKEIYEGDLIETHHKCIGIKGWNLNEIIEETRIREVKFEEFEADGDNGNLVMGWCLNDDSLLQTIKTYSNQWGESFSWRYENVYWKLVGNILENPELVK